jgi:hypothetical protein
MQVIGGVRYYKHEVTMGGTVVAKLAEGESCQKAPSGYAQVAKGGSFLNILCKDYVQIRDWIQDYSKKHSCDACRAIVDDLKFFSWTGTSAKHQSESCLESDTSSGTQPGGCPETRARLITMAYRCLMGLPVMKNSGYETKNDANENTVYVWKAMDLDQPKRLAIMEQAGKSMPDRTKKGWREAFDATPAAKRAMHTFQERSAAWAWRSSEEGFGEPIEDCKNMKCPLIRDMQPTKRSGDNAKQTQILLQLWN